MDLATRIRDIPDFPKAGILFKDITTLLKDKEAFIASIDMMAEHYSGTQIDAVVGIESRGFIFGAPLAYALGVGFIPVRKFGKLPAATINQTYMLEYGSATLEIHTDAISPGDRVLICDDLIATAGSAKATAQLIERLGGKVVGMAFLIELTFLNGRSQVADYDVFSILKY
ncbi:MAG: adenine phosphoribosyltransferase [Chloroflexi bacterium]|nr:adenine phosphoribosyltransferase [Chloroflexota bacterium]